MSNKESLSFEKSAYLFFTILNILFIFSSQALFGGLGYSVRTKSMLCLIDKSSQFCNTNKYEVEKITCAFGRRLRMRTISAVPTVMANMYVRETLSKYRV